MSGLLTCLGLLSILSVNTAYAKKARRSAWKEMWSVIAKADQGNKKKYKPDNKKKIGGKINFFKCQLKRQCR